MSDKHNEQKTKKKQLVIFGLVSFIAVLLCLASVLATAFSLMTEGVYEFESEPAQSLSPLPQTQAQVISSLKTLAQAATDDTRVYIKTSTDLRIDDESITFDGSDTQLSVLMYMKNKLLESVDAMYPQDYTGSFGDGYTDYPAIFLGDEDCSGAVCTDGSVDENGELKDKDKRLYELTVEAGADYNTEGSPVQKTFKLSDNDEFVEKLGQELSAVLTVQSFTAAPKSFTINATANRLTDRLERVVMTRAYSVNAVITFTGDLAQTGTLTIGFDYYVQENYDYKWAGVSFISDTVSIKKGTEQAIGVNAVMNNDSEYEISFTSSNPDVAVIDEMGYIKGIKTSTEPVTITVDFNYMGHSYTDTCEVYVTVPVEKIVISDEELTLAAGQTAVLSARLKPDKCTIKDIIWVSDNELVATVLLDGTVTALSPGTAVIIAVSQDGSFRDSCTLTVTQ